jgi:hypothetical protein
LSEILSAGSALLTTRTRLVFQTTIEGVVEKLCLIVSLTFDLTVSVVSGR